MGALEVVVEKEQGEGGERLERESEEEKKKKKKTEEAKEEEEEEEEEEEGKRDLEKGEGKRREDTNYIASLNRLNPTNPLRIIINGGSRLATPSPNLSQPRQASSRTTHHHHHHQPRSTPTPQQSVASLNSTKYTNKISLFLFMLHLVAAIALVSFLVFKAVQGLIGADNSFRRKEKRILKYFLPQIEAASLLSVTLAIIWQKAFRLWPRFMVHFILWSTFLMSMATGILLICFQKPSTDGVGVCLIAFAFGNGLYACWVNRRIKFSCKMLDNQTLQHSWKPSRCMESCKP